jgi:hypothetical protein
MKRYRSISVGTAVAILALAASAAAATAATVPPAPVNDNYIDSLELNAPGTKLNSVDTLKDVRDTASASVQSNIFDPCGLATCPAGPAEITTCNGVSYGNTIWYDFYPQADGTVQIQTSGFDNVVSLYTFNPNTLLPTRLRCVPGSFSSDSLVAKVKKRLAYTIQIGGVNDAGGPLEFLFDYFVPPPPRLTATATITAETSNSGLMLLNLAVATVRGTHVEVNCGDRCRPESKNVGNFGSTTVDFPHLKGVTMPSGSKLQIRVSASGSIGTLIQYTFGTAGATKQVFCMEPGSRTPRTTCH